MNFPCVWWGGFSFLWHGGPKFTQICNNKIAIPPLYFGNKNCMTLSRGPSPLLPEQALKIVLKSAFLINTTLFSHLVTPYILVIKIYDLHAEENDTPSTNMNGQLLYDVLGRVICRRIRHPSIPIITCMEKSLLTDVHIASTIFWIFCNLPFSNWVLPQKCGIQKRTFAKTHHAPSFDG